MQNRSISFWKEVTDLINGVPPVPKWTQITIHSFSLCCCIGLAALFTTQSQSLVMAQNTTSLEISQAHQQEQIVNLSADQGAIKKELEFDRSQILELRDRVSTIYGAGIGGTIILGIMQAVSMGMAMLSFRTRKNSG